AADAARSAPACCSGMPVRRRRPLPGRCPTLGGTRAGASPGGCASSSRLPAHPVALAGAGVPGRRRASITARASGIVGAMREQLPHRRRALVVTAVCLAGAIALGAAISSWSITLVLVVLLPLAMLGWQVRVDSAGLR